MQVSGWDNCIQMFVLFKNPLWIRISFYASASDFGWFDRFPVTIPRNINFYKANWMVLKNVWRPSGYSPQVFVHHPICFCTCLLFVEWSWKTFRDYSNAITNIETDVDSKCFRIHDEKPSIRQISLRKEFISFCILLLIVQQIQSSCQRYNNIL